MYRSVTGILCIIFIMACSARDLGWKAVDQDIAARYPAVEQIRVEEAAQQLAEFLLAMSAQKKNMLSVTCRVR